MHTTHQGRLGAGQTRTTELSSVILSLPAPLQLNISHSQTLNTRTLLATGGAGSGCAPVHNPQEDKRAVKCTPPHSLFGRKRSEDPWRTKSSAVPSRRHRVLRAHGRSLAAPTLLPAAAVAAAQRAPCTPCHRANTAAPSKPGLGPTLTPCGQELQQAQHVPAPQPWSPASPPLCTSVPS